MNQLVIKFIKNIEIQIYTFLIKNININKHDGPWRTLVPGVQPYVFSNWGVRAKTASWKWAHLLHGMSLGHDQCGAGIGSILLPRWCRVSNLNFQNIWFIYLICLIVGLLSCARRKLRTTPRTLLCSEWQRDTRNLKVPRSRKWLPQFPLPLLLPNHLRLKAKKLHQ